jgi:hypothetical protein
MSAFRELLKNLLITGVIIILVLGGISVIDILPKEVEIGIFHPNTGEKGSLGFVKEVADDLRHNRLYHADKFFLFFQSNFDSKELSLPNFNLSLVSIHGGNVYTPGYTMNDATDLIFLIQWNQNILLKLGIIQLEDIG